MVTTPKIRCAVIEITADDNGMIEANASRFEPRFRPSDLVPWSDPYIAGLVKKLQAEVRSEREPVGHAADIATLRAELELPWDADRDGSQADELTDDRWTTDRWAGEQEAVR